MRLISVNQNLLDWKGMRRCIARLADLLPAIEERAEALSPREQQIVQNARRTLRSYRK